MIHIAENIDVKAPDFKHGATPAETAEYYRKKGQLERQTGDVESARISDNKAKHALQLASGAAARTVFILTPGGVGGFKEIGKNVNFIGLHTLGTDFGDEVKTHEGAHNAHERNWDEVAIPGYEFMTDARRPLVYATFGISYDLNERGLIEGLTQYATQQRVSHTISRYDNFEVPESIRLFRGLEKKSGKKMIGAFLDMALRGSTSGKKEFADGVRIGGNVILLEQALKNAGMNIEHAQKMSKIIEAQRKDFVVKDMAQATELAESYAEVMSKLAVDANELGLGA